MALSLLVLLHHSTVLKIDLAIDLLAQGTVLGLLGHVQVDRVIVSREFVAFEELNCGLVQLQHDDFMQ